jgi:hypothetical protein
VQSAVATLKRYLAEDRYRIRLHDLLMGAVEDARSRWSGLGLELNSPQPTDETIVSRIKSYEASMEVLLPMAVQLGKWAKTEHFGVVCEILQAIAELPRTQGQQFRLWQELSRYPSTLFLFAAGLSALRSDNLGLLGRVLSVPLKDDQRKDEPAVSELLPLCLVDRRENLWPLFEGQKRYTPLSDWLEGRMRACLAPDTDAEQYNDPFKQVFDEFELMSAVVYRVLVRPKRQHLWVPFGCWGWRRSGSEGYLETFKNDLAENGAGSKLMRLGVFRNQDEASEVLSEVTQFANQLHLR